MDMSTLKRYLPAKRVARTAIVATLTLIVIALGIAIGGIGQTAKTEDMMGLTLGSANTGENTARGSGAAEKSAGISSSAPSTDPDTGKDNTIGTEGSASTGGNTAGNGSASTGGRTPAPSAPPAGSDGGAKTNPVSGGTGGSGGANPPSDDTSDKSGESDNGSGTDTTPPRHGHWEEVALPPVVAYRPIYGSICAECGEDISGHASEHLKATHHSGYYEGVVGQEAYEIPGGSDWVWVWD